MPLAVEDMARIDALVATLGTGADATTVAYALQRLVPSLALRRCDAADVLELPFRSLGTCDLHLLDVSGHCIRVTDALDETSGILIAERTIT